MRFMFMSLRRREKVRILSSENFQKRSDRASQSGYGPMFFDAGGRRS